MCQLFSKTNLPFAIMYLDIGHVDVNVSMIPNITNRRSIIDDFSSLDFQIDKISLLSKFYKCNFHRDIFGIGDNQTIVFLRFCFQREKFDKFVDISDRIRPKRIDLIQID